VTDDEAFIRRIVDSPGDDLPRLVYADWLDERADPRGAYLRAEAAAPGDTAKLPPPATGLDPVWVARVSRPPVGVCCDRVRFTDCGPPLTPEAVAAAERALGVTFPAELWAFLLNYNGGAPRPGRFAPFDAAAARPEGVREFASLGKQPGDAPACDVLAVTEGIRTGGVPPDLLFLGWAEMDDDVLLLSTAGAHSGSVHYWSIFSMGYEESHVSPVALSLGHFLALMTHH
jgi:uncharacterized protein (TIGR02996 family)